MGAKLRGVLTPSRNQRELMEEGGGDVLTALFKAGGADLWLYFFFLIKEECIKERGRQVCRGGGGSRNARTCQRVTKVCTIR
jgi:hypothetical protein